MNSITIPEEAILQECMSGNCERFAEIVERYKSLVCAITFNITGDIDASEELAHETFVTAWKQLPSLRDPSKIRSWLCGIARNLGKDWIRRKRVHRTAVQTLDWSQSPAVDTPDISAIRKEEEALLWGAIENIPPMYREPLILFYREHRSVEAVAEALELSPDAVKQRLSRGRGMLKERIAAFVETTLERTGPKQVFTAAVLAALPAALPQAAAAGLSAASAKGSLGAKTAAIISISGAWLGIIIGFVGGGIAFWVGYRELRSEPERQAYRSMLYRIILYFAAYFLLIMTFGPSYRAWRGLDPSGAELLVTVTCLTVVFTMGFMLIFVRWKERIVQIQKEQGTYIDPIERKREKLFADPTKEQIVGRYLGVAIAATVWMFPLAIQTGEWLTAGLLAFAALVVSISAIYFRIQQPRYETWILVVYSFAIYIVDSIALNLNWDTWKVLLDAEMISLWMMNLLFLGAWLLVLRMIFEYQGWKKKVRQNG